MTCNDCGDAISMNEICKTPLQSATGMLKHMAVHNASRAFAAAEILKKPEPELDGAIPSSKLSPILSAFQQEEIDSTALRASTHATESLLNASPAPGRASEGDGLTASHESLGPERSPFSIESSVVSVISQDALSEVAAERND